MKNVGTILIAHTSKKLLKKTLKSSKEEERMMGKTKISYARQCAIIPAKDGKMGYSEDVIIVETSTIEDGQEIIEKQIFNRQNERIGIIDKDGNIQFVEEYKQKLQESLGKERYEQLGIDKRQITLDELSLIHI